MSKICPLTIRLPQATSIVGAPQGEIEGAGCIGAQCAWYVPITDGSGRVVDGNCAAALIPTALAMINRQLSTKVLPNSPDVSA